MGLMALFRRAAALLVAVGLLAVSVAGVSADNGDEETAVAAVATELRPTRVVAEIPEGYETLFPLEWGGGSLLQLKGRLADLGCAMNTLWFYDRDRWNGYNRYDLTYDFPTNRQFLQHYDQEVPAGTLYATCADQPVGNDLQPTQIIAEVPEEYDTMFELQWGGGSLLHFKGRLATMGCIANNIEIHDLGAGRTYTYNQYNTNSTDRANQQFLTSFEQFIPSGAFSADCYNICEFKDRECVSFEGARDQHQYYTSEKYRLQDAICTNDFHPIVKEKVFPILPMLPNICIIRSGNNTGFYGVGGTTYTSNSILYTLNIQPFIMIFSDKNYYRRDNEHSDILLHAEIHELCHINQRWHWTQRLAPNLSYNYSANAPWQYLQASEHGKEFMIAIGYQIGGIDYVPSATVYKDIYSPGSIIELSAELCTMYILDKMGLNTAYNYRTWNMWDKIFEEIPIRDFNVNKYLTPQIREWLETYMILPEITE